MPSAAQRRFAAIPMHTKKSRQKKRAGRSQHRHGMDRVMWVCGGMVAMCAFLVIRLF